MGHPLQFIHIFTHLSTKFSDNELSNGAVVAREDPVEDPEQTLLRTSPEVFVGPWTMNT